MSAEMFDIVVLGGGKAGKKVALIEQGMIGGDVTTSGKTGNLAAC